MITCVVAAFALPVATEPFRFVCIALPCLWIARRRSRGKKKKENKKVKKGGEPAAGCCYLPIRQKLISGINEAARDGG
jgi:hypothetical protein